MTDTNRYQPIANRQKPPIRHFEEGDMTDMTDTNRYQPIPRSRSGAFGARPLVWGHRSQKRGQSQDLARYWSKKTICPGSAAP